MASRDQIPVLAVGWDVGGWLGEKQGVAVAELSSDATRWFIPTKPFCANDACKELASPIDLIAQAWTEVPRDVLDRYRVVIAIDAPLGFPVAFQQLVRGDWAPSPMASREIDNPLAYRECERFIHRQHGKKPLSATFDKLGNTATLAQATVARWRAEAAFHVLPFQDVGGDREIIEVYPALEKSKGSIAPWVHHLLAQSETSLPTNTDVRDAVICASLALAYSAAGRREGLPLLVGPEGSDAAAARLEGWVYAPARSTG